MNPMVFTILDAERRLEAQRQAANTGWDTSYGRAVSPTAADALPRSQKRRVSLPWTRSEPACECTEPCQAC